jgi:hypothetical protein
MFISALMTIQRLDEARHQKKQRARNYIFSEIAGTLYFTTLLLWEQIYILSSDAPVEVPFSSRKYM